jgi:hypothetical protein
MGNALGPKFKKMRDCSGPQNPKMGKSPGPKFNILNYLRNFIVHWAKPWAQIK